MSTNPKKPDAVCGEPALTGTGNQPPPLQFLNPSTLTLVRKQFLVNPRSLINPSKLTLVWDILMMYSVCGHNWHPYH